MSTLKKISLVSSALAILASGLSCSTKIKQSESAPTEPLVTERTTPPPAPPELPISQVIASTTAADLGATSAGRSR